MQEDAGQSDHLVGAEDVFGVKRVKPARQQVLRSMDPTGTTVQDQD